MTNKEDEQIVRPGTRYVLRRAGWHPVDSQPDTVYCATLVDINHALRQWHPVGPIVAEININATAMEFLDRNTDRTIAVMTEVFQ